MSLSSDELEQVLSIVEGALCEERERTEGLMEELKSIKEQLLSERANEPSTKRKRGSQLTASTSEPRSCFR